MAEPILDIKPVAGTVDDGRRVTFNQVVMRKQAEPAGVLLVAIDPGAGLLVWLRPQSVIEQIARVQVPDYSDSISVNVDSPPGELGEPRCALPSNTRPGPLWELKTTAKTNALHKIFSDALGS
jgi:hypothetical protein